MPQVSFPFKRAEYLHHIHSSILGILTKFGPLQINFLP